MKIVVTGCSTGVGASIRHNLIHLGHTVIGVGIGGPDHEINLDREPVMLGSWAREFFKLHSDAEVLINNAGMTHIEWFDDHRVERVEAALRVNFLAPYVLTQAFVASRSHPDRPGIIYRVINTSTMGTLTGHRGSVGYCASKAALEMMGCTLAREWAGKRNFMILTVRPTWTENTKMGSYVVDNVARTRGWSKEQSEEYCRKETPMGRPATHDEVWQLFKFAIFDAPQMMSGGVLSMPGGSGQRL